MNWVRQNLIDNPMMAEVVRLSQVFRGKSRGALALRFVLIMAVVISAFLIWLIGQSEGRIAPSSALVSQFSFCLVVVPFLFYACIAGERERRSWDLLRVAPVTSLQLAIGKFAAMVTLVLLVHAIFVLPLVYSALAYEPYGWTSYVPTPFYEGPHGLGAGQILLGEAYSLMASILVCAITLFFSARCKRSYTALALTLGTLLLLFVFGPIFATELIAYGDFMSYLSPFLLLSELGGDWSYRDADYGNSIAAGLGTLACYGVLIGVLVLYAASTIAFADNLVRFIPKGRRHARS